MEMPRQRETMVVPDETESQQTCDIQRLDQLQICSRDCFSKMLEVKGGGCFPTALPSPLHVNRKRNFPQYYIRTDKNHPQTSMAKENLRLAATIKSLQRRLEADCDTHRESLHRVWTQKRNDRLRTIWCLHRLPSHLKMKNKIYLLGCFLRKYDSKASWTALNSTPALFKRLNPCAMECWSSSRISWINWHVSASASAPNEPELPFRKCPSSRKAAMSLFCL